MRRTFIVQAILAGGKPVLAYTVVKLWVRLEAGHTSG
jgi:hypothetical protein